MATSADWWRMRCYPDGAAPSKGAAAVSRHRRMEAILHKRTHRRVETLRFAQGDRSGTPRGRLHKRTHRGASPSPGSIPGYCFLFSHPERGCRVAKRAERAYSRDLREAIRAPRFCRDDDSNRREISDLSARWKTASCTTATISEARSVVG
jgi:hypothetical protein